MDLATAVDVLQFLMPTFVFVLAFSSYELGVRHGIDRERYRTGNGLSLDERRARK